MLRSLPHPWQPSLCKCQVGFRICLFRGLLGVHCRYGLRTRGVANTTLSIEGFSRFVTSTTAPIATGWSDSCRAGFAPAERPCLSTAHTYIPHIVDAISR